MCRLVWVCVNVCVDVSVWKSAHATSHTHTLALDTHLLQPNRFVRLDSKPKAHYIAPCLAMASWTAADIECEIKDVAALWQHRGRVDVVGSMVGNTVQKLNKIGSLKASDAIKLYQAVDGTQIPEQFKTTLNGAIDAVMTSSVELTEQPNGSEKKAATLLTLWNYMTESDWAKIDKDQSYWGVITVVVERLKSLGIDSMKECTKQWVTATILDGIVTKTGTMPTYEAIFQLTKDLKAALASCSVQAHPELPKRCIFPDSPDKISGKFMELAYSADQPPVKKDLKLVSNLAQHHVPVRDTSKLLAKNQTKSDKHASMGVSAADIARELLKAKSQYTGSVDCPIKLLHQDRAMGNSRPAVECGSPSQAMANSDAAGQEQPARTQGVGQQLAIQDAVPDACGKAVELFQPKLRKSMTDVSSALDKSLGIGKPGDDQLTEVETNTDGKGRESPKGPDGPEKLYTAEQYEQMAFDALTNGKRKKRG